MNTDVTEFEHELIAKHGQYASLATLRERARIRQADEAQRRAAEAARADRERAPYQQALDAAHDAERQWRKEQGLKSLMMPGRPR